MPTLSPDAAAMLDRMEPNRGYEPMELRTFVPDVTMDRLRAIMHELWVNRHVERFGYSGWQLHRSMSPIQEIASLPGGAPLVPPSETKGIRPEDLFDHDSFSGMFK